MVCEVVGLELWKVGMREEQTGAVCALARLGTNSCFGVGVLKILSLLSIVRSLARERYLRIKVGWLLKPLNSGLLFLLPLFSAKLIKIGSGASSLMILTLEDHAKALISASTSCSSCRLRLHSPAASSRVLRASSQKLKG